MKHQLQLQALSAGPVRTLIKAPAGWGVGRTLTPLVQKTGQFCSAALMLCSLLAIGLGSLSLALGCGCANAGSTVVSGLGGLGLGWAARALFRAPGHPPRGYGRP